jgi:hypothetical protein
MNFHRPIMTMVMAVSLFLVAGGHWATLQSVAWAGMVKDFSRTGSLTEAVGKTFDGKHPCAMCKKIASAQAHEEKAPASLKVDKKSEVFVKSCGVSLPLPIFRPVVYGPAPFVSMPERFFAPPVPVPISSRA